MSILGQKNVEAHQGRPLTPENKKITLWKPSENFIHCCIESKGCRFNRDDGACIMCDYGVGRNLNARELEFALDAELLPILKSEDTVLFGSYGSVLDKSEVSQECFDVVLSFIEKNGIKNVIFETHCCTVNGDNLKEIYERLCKNSVRVTVEMGYESCDPYILQNCLNKTLDLNQLCSAIRLTHSFGMEVSLNVFLGAPFMNEKAQLDSVIEAVKWAFERGADDIVIFPCNIKPFTFLYKIYQNNFYEPVSQWMVIELLSQIETDKLDRITLSWYGNRKNFYENDEFPLIPPADCIECHEKIFSFYALFMQERNSEKRKELIDKLISENLQCNCRTDFREKLKKKSRRLSTNEIKLLIDKVHDGEN